MKVLYNMNGHSFASARMYNFKSVIISLYKY